MTVYSTTQVAQFLGVEPWRVQRLFEDGTLDEPAKLAGRRVIQPSLIPQIVVAMQARGWLSSEAGAAS